MNVAELMAKLSDYPPDITVVRASDNCCEPFIYSPLPDSEVTVVKKIRQPTAGRTVPVWGGYDDIGDDDEGGESILRIAGEG